MEHREFMQRFEAEARRLRLNMFRLPGLAASGTGWEQELLDRMRALAPGASWEDVFPGQLLPAPDPEIADLVEDMDADPEAFWRRRDLEHELSRELERVVPSPESLAPGVSIGYTFPHGVEHALRVLRRLPDGAGSQAFHAALESTPVEE